MGERSRIAAALNLAQHELWPEKARAKATSTVAATTDLEPDTGGRDPRGEVTGAWAHTTDHNAPDPEEFLRGTDGPVEILDNGRGNTITRELARTLLERADAGRPVRLLLAAPRTAIAPLIGHPNIEIRVLDTPTAHSLLRAGETILLTVQLAGEADNPPPILRIQRTPDGGLFDRLTCNFQTLWDTSEETLTRPDQLEACLTNTDEQDLDESIGLAPVDSRPPATSRSVAAAPRGRPAVGAGEPPRRWPRRQ